VKRTQQRHERAARLKAQAMLQGLVSTQTEERRAQELFALQLNKVGSSPMPLPLFSHYYYYYHHHHHN
jgi:hypothetical protein